MKEKNNIKTKIAVVGIIALTLLIIGIISAPNVLQKMGVQVGEKEGEDAENVQVLVGKTFTSSLAGVGAAGAMADYTQNLQTAQIAANETGVSIVNIPAGYYEQIQVDASAVYEAGLNAGETTHTETYTYPENSTGATYDMGETHTYRYVNASNVYTKGKSDGRSELSGGNATASQILSGRTAYVGGSLVTGNIPSRSSGSSVTYYGTDTTGPYVYFNSGYWPSVHNTYGAYVRMTKDQVKAFANGAGVGYNAGYNANGDKKHTVKVYLQSADSHSDYGDYARITVYVDGSAVSDAYYAVSDTIHWFGGPRYREFSV